jgi:hypothetical protein
VIDVLQVQTCTPHITHVPTSRISVSIDEVPRMLGNSSVLHALRKGLAVLADEKEVCRVSISDDSWVGDVPHRNSDVPPLKNSNYSQYHGDGSTGSFEAMVMIGGLPDRF